MGLRYNKSVKICKGLKLNFSKSGISTSIKVGNVTHNSKRGTTVNLGNGLSYHVGNGKKAKGSKKQDPKPTFTERLQDAVENQDQILLNQHSKWANMSDRKCKIQNIGAKILGGILTIELLLLSIITPPLIIVAIGCGYFTYKFDTFKKREKSKEEMEKLVSKMGGTANE